jgi:superfamily II DNA or RNA helicase
MNLIPVEYNIPKLRGWQVKAKDIINSKISKCVVTVATGAGKGTLALDLIRDRLTAGKRCLFVVHRLSIIKDICEKATAMGFDYGIIQGSNTRDINHQFIIASSLSLIKQNEQFDSIFTDEAHHIYSKLEKYLISCINSEIIGFTATPFNPRMSKIYNKVICTTTADELTRDGILVPLRIKVATRINIDKLGFNSSGEFRDTDIEIEGKAILGDTVQFWIENAIDRKTIVFASTIRHAEAIAEAFLERGIQANTYTANTDEKTREVLIRKFKDKDDKLMVLTTVEALSTGFDAPIVSCIISCRPLSKSLTTFVQGIGRGLRSAPDKKDCLLIDCDGNIGRFEDDYVNLYYKGVHELKISSKLDKKNRVKQKKKAKDKTCPQCSESILIAGRCFSCGYIIEYKVDKLSHITKDIGLVDKSLGKNANSNEQVIWMMCCKTAMSSHEDKRVWRARFLYRDLIGIMPPNYWVFKPSNGITKEYGTFVRNKTLEYLKGR